MFDFEFCYMYTHELINYEILEEDLIFAYDAFPTETTRLKQEIEQRDYNDKTRDFAPLTKAQDAIEIDTSYMSVEQVISKVLSYIEG